MRSCFFGLIFFTLGGAIVLIAFLLGRAKGENPQKATLTIADLKQALKNSESDAARALLKALGHESKADGDSAVPEIEKLLNDKSESVRKSALEVLGRIGPKAKEAIPAIKERLEDSAAAVREAAKEALQKIAGSNDEPDPDAPARSPSDPKSDMHGD